MGSHPQIPELLSFEQQDGRFYLVQQFIDGQDLLKELHQKGKFSEKKIKQLLNDLLPVLEFCHRQKVIHPRSPRQYQQPQQCQQSRLY